MARSPDVERISSRPAGQAEINEKDSASVAHEDTKPDLSEGKKKEVDDAYKFVQEHGLEGATVSEEESKRVLRKIDRILMPLLFVTYMFNYLDKHTLSYSANFGLREDNHLSGNQYSWSSGSIFYLCYLFAQPLISKSLQFFPIGRFVTAMVLIWGILLVCTAGSRSFAGLMTLRALLGAVESCINPAFIVITSQWYTRQEQPSRISYWFAANAIGHILGGLIGYGIGHIPYDKVGRWIWYFVIFGGMSVLYSIVLFLYLPDNPMKARWLTQREKEVAILRVLDNRTGFVNHKWKWNQFFEAFLDVKTWLIFIIAALNTIPSGAIASYGSIVIKGFGYSAINTTLLNMPQGVIQLVSVLFSGWFVSKYNNTRCWVMGLSQIPGLIGSVLLYVLPDHKTNAKLGSYYLISTHSVIFPILMAVLSANYAGFTKKTTATAFVFAGWCSGMVIAPQLFKESEAPTYPTVFATQFACFALLVVLPLVLQGWFMWCNKSRDNEFGQPGSTLEDEHVHDELLDATDIEQRARFRYVY